MAFVNEINNLNTVLFEKKGKKHEDTEVLFECKYLFWVKSRI